ncbi:MAG: 16S rRNA (guanine(527)-N(7))-methyltransferase RsmG [Desulfamplus sp.]|nr:16S rRNA (guanine(527)-N(7))-methyltransferase RsmG [Desulfamplus sp.]
MDKQETSKIFNKQWQQTVEEGSAAFGVKLSQMQLELFTFHAQELIKWNSRFNITAIVEPFDVALKHFIDSIAAAPLILDGSKVIDLGSGGGFPGMPLKIVKPSLEVVMADSSEKKVNFLKYLISQMRLIEDKFISQKSSTKVAAIGFCAKEKSVKAIHCRAEELCKSPDYAHQFDYVISRAFTSLSKFTDMALPFLKNNGVILAMKGELKEDELNLIINRKDITTEISEYVLPFEPHKRCVVKIKLK